MTNYCLEGFCRKDLVIQIQLPEALLFVKYRKTDIDPVVKKLLKKKKEKKVKVAVKEAVICCMFSALHYDLN